MLPSVQWVLAGIGLILSLYILPFSVQSIVSLVIFIVPELKWREKILSELAYNPPPALPRGVYIYFTSSLTGSRSRST